MDPRDIIHHSFFFVQLNHLSTSVMAPEFNIAFKVYVLVYP